MRIIYHLGVITLVCTALCACNPSKNSHQAQSSDNKAAQQSPSNQTNTTDANPPLNINELIINDLIINETTQSDFSAHWLAQDLIVLNTVDTNLDTNINTNKQYYLAKLDSHQSQPRIVNAVLLQPSQLSDAALKQSPHLSSFSAFSLNSNTLDIKEWLKHKIAVITVNPSNLVQTLAYVQHQKVLDDVFAVHINEQEPLGTFISGEKIVAKLWAPTALDVKLLLFTQDKEPLENSPIQMVEDKKTGIWSTNLAIDNLENYYQYQVTVYHPAIQKITTIITTDPYSLSLSTNSTHSQIVDLTKSHTQPHGWLNQKDNVVYAPEDNIFYETHIRDFSFADQNLSSESVRGKYAAFNEKSSDGILHFQALHNAGINSIHLLPVFDIGTVNEENGKAVDLNSTVAEVCTLNSSITICKNITEEHQQKTLQQLLESYDPLSADAQALISAINTLDKYNWGYDPFHYTVPEGSYAKNPEGLNRIIEFRSMVQSLHNIGFRVIMDVVYNHTHQAGLERTAVLDKIVPNYYQRLHPITGNIEQSTCCDNTATENKMMKKLMIDSLIVWARDYKIDGFRFDLMAHQPKEAMLAARTAVQAVDHDNYFYGEGWNFGEVANNQRFIQASQLELSGSEIGTFTDRLRDAVRGGAFSASGNDIRKSQGIGSGLATLNNELVGDTSSTIANVEAIENSENKYRLFADQLRVSLAGNLLNFPLVNAQNQKVTGKDIPYGDQPTGYALDPADTINYVSKHDNQTLWDNNQYRLPFDLSTENRVRLHLQSLAYPIFAQGIPFIHMGSELLRSKSFLRDSYDYNDWFNKVDFSMQSNNYNVGLPPAEKDQANWPLIKEIIEKNQGHDLVTPADISFSKEVFLTLIKIRMSSPLFRLTTGEQIIERVKFHNTGSDQQIGLIAMSIDDQLPLTQLDEDVAQIMVIFNTSLDTKTLAFEHSEQFQLHRFQLNGVDEQVKLAHATNNGFNIPPLTTAVFIKQRVQ